MVSGLRHDRHHLVRANVCGPLAAEPTGGRRVRAWDRRVERVVVEHWLGSEPSG
jgi:hypothetical protein